MGSQPFDAGAAFVYLDDVAARLGPSQSFSIELAWEAAWIVCMTVDRRHDEAARAALAEVVIDVDCLSLTSTSALTAALTALVPL